MRQTGSTVGSRLLLPTRSMGPVLGYLVGLSLENRDGWTTPYAQTRLEVLSRTVCPRHLP